MITQKINDLKKELSESQEIFEATILNIIYDLNGYSTYSLSQDFNIKQDKAYSILKKMYDENILIRQEFDMPNKKFKRVYHLYYYNHNQENEK